MALPNVHVEALQNGYAHAYDRISQLQRLHKPDGKGGYTTAGQGRIGPEEHAAVRRALGLDKE